jgi:hypothetical protein
MSQNVCKTTGGRWLVCSGRRGIGRHNWHEAPGGMRAVSGGYRHRVGYRSSLLWCIASQGKWLVDGWCDGLCWRSHWSASEKGGGFRGTRLCQEGSAGGKFGDRVSLPGMNWTCRVHRYHRKVTISVLKGAAQPFHGLLCGARTSRSQDVLKSGHACSHHPEDSLRMPLEVET